MNYFEDQNTEKETSRHYAFDVNSIEFWEEDQFHKDPKMPKCGRLKEAELNLREQCNCQ